MSEAPGKHRYRALGLAARDAARRFASRLGRAGNGLGAWRPIVLRWRQRPKRAEKAPAGRAASPAQVLWFPQVHFHFATHLSERARSERLVRSLPVAGLHPARVLLEQHHWTSVRCATFPLQARQTDHPLRASYARNPAWPLVHAGLTATAGVSWPPVAQPLALWPEHRPRPLFIVRSPAGVRASRQEAERTQPLPGRTWIRQHGLQVFSLRALAASEGVRASRQGEERTQSLPGRTWIRQHWLPVSARRAPAISEGVRASRPGEEWTQSMLGRAWIRQHGLQVFSLRAPAPSADVPPRSHESKRLQFQFDRPEEIVWRRGLRSPTVMTDDRRQQERSESFHGSGHGPGAHSIPSQGTAPAVSSGSERAAAMQITKLDPSLLDRVTDDVIRRVEQRMRIERERRGL